VRIRGGADQDLRRRAWRTGRFERPAQCGDVRLHRAHGARRRIVAVDEVDQAVERDHPASRQQQHGEHGPLAWSTEVDRRAVPLDGQRPEHLHPHLALQQAGNGRTVARLAAPS
jgi:hypothetical protein